MNANDGFNNIDAFDIAEGEIFAALYDAFPIRITLDCGPVGLDEGRKVVLRVPEVPYKLHSVIHSRGLDWRRVLIDDLCGRGRLDEENINEPCIGTFYAELDSIKDSAVSAGARFEELKRFATVKAETADWLCEMGYISVEDEKKRKVEARVEWEYDERPPIGIWECIPADYVQIEFSTLHNARLTSKGLEALRAVPSSLVGTENEASLGEQLKDQISKTGSEVRQQSVSKIVGAVIGHAVGAMTGVGG